MHSKLFLYITDTTDSLYRGRHVGLGKQKYQLVLRSLPTSGEILGWKFDLPVGIPAVVVATVSKSCCPDNKNSDKSCCTVDDKVK